MDSNEISMLLIDINKIHLIQTTLKKILKKNLLKFYNNERFLKSLLDKQRRKKAILKN